MSETQKARKNILSRLKQTPVLSQERCLDFSVVDQKKWSPEEKIERLKNMMEAVHTEVRVCNEKTWGRTLRAVVKEKQIKKMLYGANTDFGEKLGKMQKRTPDSIPKLVDYKNSVEKIKKQLFNIDAAISTTLGGIAETGSLIVWPTVDEPRLMTLVPPIHIAVLDASSIYNTFREAMLEQNWNQGMPSNALLISGPSKTADIEQTLVYGVHGCKELVVILVKRNG